MAECVSTRAKRLEMEKDTKRWSCQDCKALFLKKEWQKERKGKGKGKAVVPISYAGVCAVELGSGPESSARMKKSTPGTACESTSGLCWVGECCNKISWSSRLKKPFSC